MLKYSFKIALAAFLFTACGSDEQEKAEQQKLREQQIADSVAKALTGKSIDDPANTERIEKIKKGETEAAEYRKADAAALKELAIEYDYDNKPFNKSSDVDGKLFNRSSMRIFKNIQMKVVCKDKKGNITKSFVHTENSILQAGASKKFRIKFEDSDKTKDATVTIIAADEKQ
jgi:hypothetical protein